MMGTLAAKIAKASAIVGALATDKRNVQQGYDYISADKILERAGDAIAAQGIIIVPGITDEQTEVVQTGNGKTRYDSRVFFKMVVSCEDDEITMPWCGRGSDFAVPDKAMYKAITSGHKYFLMKLLNVGVGNEDGEHDEVDDAPVKKQTPPKQQGPAAEASFPNASERKESPPHNRVWGLGQSLFGAEWDEARRWLLEAWTRNFQQPARSHMGELSDDEKDLLADYMKANGAGLQKSWQKKKMAKAA